MVLSQKQTHGSMKQDRKPRNKAKHLLSKKKARIYKGEKTVNK